MVCRTGLLAVGAVAAMCFGGVTHAYAQSSPPSQESVPKFEKFNPSHALSLDALLRGAREIEQSTQLAASPVTQESVAFLVKYNDGATETIVSKYSGILESSRWETGHPSRPLQGEFVDNRQCHWSVNAYVRRDLCTVSRSLGEKCEGRWTEIHYIRQGGSGEPASWTRIQGENCGDAGPKIDNMITSVRQLVIAQTPSIVVKDLGDVEKIIRGRPDVVDLSKK